MKPALALLPLFAIGAVGQDVPETPAQADVLTAEIAPDEPEVRLSMPNPGSAKDTRCDDYIRQVRRDRGLPGLRREPAQPSDGALWSAVDRRIDDCPVLVRHGNPADIRPFPGAQDGPLFRRIPVGEE